MTTSYINAQYAPGVPDSERDTICDRIRLIPIDESFGLNGVPGGQPLVPQLSPTWTFEHVNKIMSVSPALQAIFNRLRANPGSYWNIDSRPEEDGIDVTLTINVLSLVAAETERHHVVIDRVARVVSRYSNVMWFYQIIPERFPSAYQWIVYDRSEAPRTVIGASYVPPPLRQVATHDTHHRRRPTNSPGNILWCWSEPTGELPYEIVAPLANCALVIGWKEVFKRAIKPLIWETRPHNPGLQTPVKYLKEDGPDGIKKRRDQEKDQVLAHLLRCLANYRKFDAATVDKAITVLSEHGIEVGDMPDSFAQPSVYQLLRDIETALMSTATITTGTSPALPPPPPPQPPAAPEQSRRGNTRQPTHGSQISSSSSGSNHSAPSPGRNLDATRRDISMTGSSSNTHKSNGYKRHSGNHGGPSSSGTSLSSPRQSTILRPTGMSSGPLVRAVGAGLRAVGTAFVAPFSGSTGRDEARPDPGPEPDAPPPPKKGGTPKYDDFVRNLLQELHELVLYRQAVVAEDILARRDEDIESWKARML